MTYAVAHSPLSQSVTLWLTVADSGFANGWPRSSAAGASIEAPRGVGREEEDFFDFRSKNVDF